MSTTRTTRRSAVAILAALAVGAALFGAIPAVGSTSGYEVSDYVIVELSSPGAVAYEGGIRGIPATKPENGWFDPESPAFEAYRRHLENEHAAFRAALGRHAPDADVVREFFVTANAVALELHGADRVRIARINGVKAVYEVGLYRPTMNESVGLIDADEVWAEVAREDAGDGVKVGVIDSGIWDLRWAGPSFEDIYHPFFECKETQFGGVFYSGETGTPRSDRSQGFEPAPGALFSSDHGTHVAGTIGGCVTTIDDGSIWNGIELSGVAPGVELWDYNVFPAIGAGWVAFDGAAMSHDIAAAIETAVLDGIDVINMSLGGGAQGPHDFLAEVSNAAVDAGVVVVTSAGNEGDGNFTVGSPGSAEKVIAVAASTNTRTRSVEVRVPDWDPIEAFPGEFPDFDGTPTTLIDWPGSDNLACTSDVADDSLGGEIVLIERGDCTFSEKIDNAADAGAGGVIVYTDDRDPGGMATSPGEWDVVPAVMIARDPGIALEDELEASGSIADVEVTAPFIEYLPSEEVNQVADFSSRGPAPFTASVKPDVMAPGVDILSSVFVSGDWDLFDGTSMASPHVAGVAALVLADDGSLLPAQVKSAVVTTAVDQGFEVWEQGSGLVNAARAVDANAYFSPSNASFGIFEGKKPASGVVEISITGPAAGSCEVESVTGDSASYFDAAVDSQVLTVEFEGGREVPTGLHNGTVVVDCDGDDHVVTYGAVVDRKDG